MSPISSDAHALSQHVIDKYLLRSAQEQAQIFEACYENEKREHARTRKMHQEVNNLLLLQEQRVDWLLGGPWPGKHEPERD